MSALVGVSPRKLYDLGDYSGAIARCRELARHAGERGRLLRKVGRAFDPSQRWFMAGRPDAVYVARTEAIRLARTVSRSFGQQVNDLLCWSIANNGDVRKEREYDRRVAELCVKLWERAPPIDFRVASSPRTPSEDKTMPDSNRPPESPQERWKRMKDEMLHRKLDELDPVVQAERAKEASRRSTKARKDYERLRRDPEYIAKAREASLEKGGGSAAAILAAQIAAQGPDSLAQWEGPEHLSVQRPVTYIAPGLVTATVNSRNPGFATVHQALSEVGAVPVAEGKLTLADKKEKGPELPWKEVARRMDIARYPAPKWRALMAYCRRQPIGSPVRGLLTDRSADAVEKARQAANVIVR